MYVAIFSSIFIVLFALLILFYLDINAKLSEYVGQFEESNNIILNKLADVRDDIDTMNVELRGEVSKMKNKMNSHNSGHVNSEKVKKDLKQWTDNSIKENEKMFKTMNSKIDSMEMELEIDAMMFRDSFDEKLDDLMDSHVRISDSIDTTLNAVSSNLELDNRAHYNQLREDTNNVYKELRLRAENTYNQFRDDTDGALERVGTVLEEIDDRLDRYDDNFDYINKEISK